MRRSRFTLIELLVVISIIAILMAILLPAVMAAYRETQKTKGRGQMAMVKSSVQQYVDTYGTLPIIADQALVTQAFLEEYLVKKTGNSNPREIPFLPNAKLDKLLTMPWGATEADTTYGMKVRVNTSTQKVTVYAQCPWGGSYITDSSTSLASVPAIP